MPRYKAQTTGIYAQPDTCDECHRAMIIFPVEAGFAAHCTVCDVVGPVRPTPHEATIAWNTREVTT